MPEAPYVWAVVVTTPPPSKTFVVARAPTFEEAKAKANEWGGGIEWTGVHSGVAYYGERVDIEPVRKPRTEEPLRFPRWDEVFETGVFEEHLGPELGFKLNEYGEVAREQRKEFEKVSREVDRWLMSALSVRGIEAYSAAGGLIYPSDVEEMAKELEARRPIREGPKEWAPPKPGHTWSLALARALRKMVEKGR